MATDKSPQESTPQAPIVFVENLGSAAEAGERWRKDVESGKKVVYLSEKGYLGCTEFSPGLRAWLSKLPS